MWATAEVQVEAAKDGKEGEDEEEVMKEKIGVVFTKMEEQVEVFC